jgi:heme-degrading monooxygenase HmoA
MHIQIITFRLRNRDEAGYRQFADGVAPALAEVPGLISKVWLADPQSNTYGGVLFWQGRIAMERFAGSDKFRHCSGTRTSPICPPPTSTYSTGHHGLQEDLSRLPRSAP